MGHAALHAWKRTGSDPWRGRALPALPKPTPRTRGVSSRCHHLCDPSSFFHIPTPPPYSEFYTKTPPVFIAVPVLSPRGGAGVGSGGSWPCPPDPDTRGKGRPGGRHRARGARIYSTGGMEASGAAGGCRETASPGGRSLEQAPPQILPGAPGTNPVSWEMCWPLPDLPGWLGKGKTCRQVGIRRIHASI